MDQLVIEKAMKRALELALLGPITGINPQVGAVILDSLGEVIGEGYHAGSGTKHAEVVALQAALSKRDSLPPGCIAVVSLEPCNHTGKTPPCASALIEAGVSEVYFAVSDPGEDSSGGSKTLQRAGVKVHSGTLNTEAEEQLRVWLTASRKKRPYVCIKWAASLDGRIAAQDKTSKWISSALAREHAHKKRSEVDAILIGTGTALEDNPTLSARKPDGEPYPMQPIRVVLGKRELPKDLNIFSGDTEVISLQTNSLDEALSELYQRGIKHVLVEGGPTVASSFIKADLVDEYWIYIAPKLLGGDQLAVRDIGIGSIEAMKNLRFSDLTVLGEDIFVEARPKN